MIWWGHPSCGGNTIVISPLLLSFLFHSQSWINFSKNCVRQPLDARLQDVNVRACYSQRDVVSEETIASGVNQYAISSPFNFSFPFPPSHRWLKCLNHQSQTWRNKHPLVCLVELTGMLHSFLLNVNKLHVYTLWFFFERIFFQSFLKNLVTIASTLPSRAYRCTNRWELRH